MLFHNAIRITNSQEEVQIRISPKFEKGEY